MQSNLFNLNGADFRKGLIMAVLSGFALPILALIQSPSFSFSNVDWHGVIVLAINGAAVGFGSYIMKNLFSDSQGKVLGRF